MRTMAEADEVVHSVESEWHYPIVTNAGFVAETKERVGLVRSYTYKHPNGITVICATGYSSDYWQSSDGERGYWGSLEPYVKKFLVS